MELLTETLPGGATRAIAIGRWDVAGAAAIDLRLSVLAGSGRSIVIDMVQVSFLSSMGIRSIVMAAKAASLRHAKVVLLGPNQHVEEVLTTTGIDTVVPIHGDIQAALAALSTG